MATMIRHGLVSESASVRLAPFRLGPVLVDFSLTPESLGDNLRSTLQHPGRCVILRQLLSNHRSPAA